MEKFYRAFEIKDYPNSPDPLQLVQIIKNEGSDFNSQDAAEKAAKHDAEKNQVMHFM